MIITLTGPTAAGKSTVEAELAKLGCGRAISHTTRHPRVGEVNGREYHFVNEVQFADLEEHGEFIEVIDLGTRRYAMSQTALRAASRDFRHTVIVVEPHGAQQIHAFCRKHRIPSMPVWISCSEATQAHRWVMRLAGDLVIGKEAVGVYAERLALMLTVETDWRRDAGLGFVDLDGSLSYELCLSSEKSSAAALAQVILKQAELSERDKRLELER